MESHCTTGEKRSLCRNNAMCKKGCLYGNDAMWGEYLKNIEIVIETPLFLRIYSESIQGAAGSCMLAARFYFLQ